jgi:3',5'-cyclic AMP phosphodiesterase CpdA
MSAEEIPKPFTFLVLADVHFGQLADSPEFRVNGKRPSDGSLKRLSRRDGLVATILKLSEKPTALFVPGDLTSIASPAEFKGCVDIALGIADDLGIPRDHIFFTYGNHDTNWRICELGTETARFPADTAYDHVAATIGGLYAPTKNCILEGPVPGSGVFRAANHTVFVLNSGFFCVAEQTYRHGRIGSEQLKWIEGAFSKFSSSAGWKLLMVHHHPFNYTYPTPIEDVSCIEEGAEVVDLAGRYGIDLLFHGHRHHPRLFTELRTDWKSPMTFFCAGSVAVNAQHRDSGLIPNLFHVVTLQNRLTTRAAFGNVTSFEFTTEGWMPVNYKGATPLDHIHWFGSLVSEHETDNAIRSFIQGVVQPPSKLVMLPPRETLPAELRCCSLVQLNSRLSVIAREFGFQLLSKYPEEAALRKIS